MNDASSFGLVFLLLLVSLTGSSYYMEKYEILDRVLEYKFSRKLAWFCFALNTAVGIGLFFFEVILGLLFIYLSLLIFTTLKTGSQYRWLPGIIKIGYLFIVVYLFLWSFEEMPFWEKIRLVF